MYEMLLEDNEIHVFYFIVCSRRCVFSEEEEDNKIIDFVDLCFISYGQVLILGADGIPLLHHFLLHQPKVVLLGLCWVWKEGRELIVW